MNDKCDYCGRPFENREVVYSVALTQVERDEDHLEVEQLESGDLICRDHISI